MMALDERSEEKKRITKVISLHFTLSRNVGQGIIAVSKLHPLETMNV